MNTSTSINHSQVAVFIKTLIADRCKNYGYNDYKDFKRISNQRSKARSELKSFYYYNPQTVLERLQAENRVVLDDVKVVRTTAEGIQVSSVESRLTYVVGQSGNEEITNLMRRLVNPTAKWVK